ncbi:MAG: TRAP transporter small permease [Eubacterium sp.]|nr:TRAP transporter small permease [Eubacterium sp.]MBQ9091248.1 TRAP transporter small permease [Anaerotignum sp.]
MKILNAYSKFLDKLTKVLKAVLIAMLAVMVLIMFYQVIMRYVFSSAKPWAEELTLYISIFMIMLALGIASRNDSHLQVDFLTRMYKPRMRCFMTAFWSVVSIIVMALFAYFSISLMGHATARSVTLPITMAQVYTAFPIGAVILILYSIEIAARNIVGFKNGGELPAFPSEQNGGGEA